MIFIFRVGILTATGGGNNADMRKAKEPLPFWARSDILWSGFTTESAENALTNQFERAS
jgi:hypothetical protein